MNEHEIRKRIAREDRQWMIYQSIIGFLALVFAGIVIFTIAQAVLR